MQVENEITLGLSRLVADLEDMASRYHQLSCAITGPLPPPTFQAPRPETTTIAGEQPMAERIRNLFSRADNARSDINAYISNLGSYLNNDPKVAGAARG